MLKNKQPMPVNIRASMQQQQQLASARNRRLAQQMENRPSVQAALKLKQVRGRVLMLQEQLVLSLSGSPLRLSGRGGWLQVAQGKSRNFSGGKRSSENPQFVRYQWVTFCCLSLVGSLPSSVTCSMLSMSIHLSLFFFFLPDPLPLK